jgi:hypothetical protein
VFNQLQRLDLKKLLEMLIPRFQLINCEKCTLQPKSTRRLCALREYCLVFPIQLSHLACTVCFTARISLYTSGTSTAAVNAISILTFLFSSQSIGASFEPFPALNTVFTGTNALLYIYSDINYRITVQSWSRAPAIILCLQRQFTVSISGFEPGLIIQHIW